MQNSLFNSFTQHLIEKTMTQVVTWNQLTPIPEKDAKNNNSLYFALFSNEFHQVRFESSYSLDFEQGYIYLIDEVSMSGQDRTIFDGLNLYVQPTQESNLTLVVHNNSELYRLKNAITNYRMPPKEAIDFINSFLNS